MAIAAPAPVVVPPRSWRNDVRAVRIVWHRDLIRFWHDKPRMLASILQPMLYLFVPGTGMGSSLRPRETVALRVFLFPGGMAMSTRVTCFFRAGSIVWDGEFGFMREMLVAPVRRGSILLGKAFGGATAGMIQGVVVLLLGPLVGVHFTPLLVLTLVAELTVLAFAITSIGVLVAVRIKSFQAFMALVQIIIMPMFFLSGALFPMRGLPAWLHVSALLDPLSYAVDPMRRAVLSTIDGADMGGMTWSGWLVPAALEVAIVAATGVIALTFAARAFAKTE